MKVKEIMVREVVTVTPQMDLERLLALFREQRITGAPVVDDDSRLVGIVSKDDVLYRRQQGADSGPVDVEQLFKGGFAAVGGGPRQAAKVSEIMTRDVVTAGPDSSLREACRKLWDRRIHRLPIVEGGRLVGLLSVLDVCRAIAEGELKA